MTGELQALQDHVAAEELRSYAYRHVNTVRDEYKKQVEKWTRSINTIADCQIAALDRHKKVVAAKDDGWMVGLALLAFSFVGGGAVDWLGKLVSKRLASRYSAALTDSFDSVTRAYTVGKKYTADYADLTSTFWGGGVKKTVGNLLSKVTEKHMPESQSRGEYGGLSGAIMGSSLLTFKTELQNAMSKASEAVNDGLALFAGNINQNEQFGFECLKASDDWTGAANKFVATVHNVIDPRHPAKPIPKLNPADAERVRRGKMLLDDYFNALRKVYAESWFYYGNDPDHLNAATMTEAIEVQIWKLWVLGQEFRIEKIAEPLITEDRRAQGKDGRRLDQGILEHLSDDLSQTELYDLYYKIYKQTYSKDIETDAELDIVRRWAAKPPPSMKVLRYRRRTLASITDLVALFGSSPN